MSPLGLRTGWLTGLALTAVLAVNLAGLGAIAAARRGAMDEARREFQEETASRGWLEKIDPRSFSCYLREHALEREEGGAET